MRTASLPDPVNRLNLVFARLIMIPVLFGTSILTPALIPELEEAGASIEADSYQLDQATGWTTATGNVKVAYGRFQLEAGEIRYNVNHGEVGAYGDVRLSGKSETGETEFIWHSDRIEGNLHQGNFHSPDYKLVHGDVYVRGPRAKRDRDGRFELDSARLSTCGNLLEDDRLTHFHVHARSLQYTPATERFRMRHSWFRIAGVPVFYWPLLSWGRDWTGEDVILQAGHSSAWGAFAVLGRRWQPTDDLSTRLGVELRARRGIALSATAARHRDRSVSELSLYGMRDAEPPETEPGFNRRFNTRRDRYRIQFYHFHDLSEDWDLRLQVDKLSDIDMLEEWFEAEFRHRPQPRSFLDLRRQQENHNLALLLRPRINDFYTVVERLPELQFGMPRQHIRDSGFYYQGENSMAHLRMKWRDFDRSRAPDLFDGPEDYQAWRLDSLHMLYRPFDLGGNLQWIPRAGLRMTHYSRSSREKMTTTDLINLYQVDDPYAETVTIPIRNYDQDGGAVTRWAGEAGMELSKKYLSMWPPGIMPRMVPDRARMITRPYTNYTYLPDPSRDREQIYHFDRTDRIMKQHFLRAGVENRLQARSGDRYGITTTARVNTYADFHLETPSDRGSLGNLANSLELTPPGNVSFANLILFDLDRGQFNYVRNRITWKDLLETAADLSVAYTYSDSYLSTELNSMGSTLLDYRGESLSALEFAPTNEVRTRIDFPLGGRTAGAVGFGYDFNESDSSHQLLEISRNFHCWTGAVRYQRSGSGDNARTEVTLMLYLSAFPGVGLGYGL